MLFFQPRNGIKSSGKLEKSSRKVEFSEEIYTLKEICVLTQTGLCVVGEGMSDGALPVASGPPDQ